MNKTDIEWTTFSANPLKFRRKGDGKVVWGCVKTSPGCRSCYAEAIALRFERGKLFNAKNMEELEPFLDEAELHKMLTAKTIGGVSVDGSLCFVGDMTDVFGEWVPDELLDRLFAMFALRPSVTWQVLTKRAERLRQYFEAEGDEPADGLYMRWGAAAGCLLDGDWIWGEGRRFRPMIERFISAAHGFEPDDQERMPESLPWPLPNVHLGVSVENQKYADERILHVLATPAVVRFLSVEPMLGLVILHKYFAPCECGHGHGFTVCPNTGGVARNCHVAGCSCSELRPLLNWVIVGGESGPGARRFELDWARSIQSQCEAVGVPWFFKQAGSNPHDWNCGDPLNHVPPEVVPLRLRDRKGGDLSELSPSLRVRQFPGEATP